MLVSIHQLDLAILGLAQTTSDFVPPGRINGVLVITVVVEALQQGMTEHGSLIGVER